MGESERMARVAVRATTTVDRKGEPPPTRTLRTMGVRETGIPTMIADSLSPGKALRRGPMSRTAR
jgi:hypothetical protein